MGAARAKGRHACIACRQRWKLDLGSPITSSPAATEQAVYVGSSDGIVYAVDPKVGKQLWHYATAGPVPSSPIVNGDTVYIGSTDHNVYALPA